MKSRWIATLLVAACANLLAPEAKAQRREDGIKSGLTAADRAYTMGEGVTAKDVTYYSEGVACYAKMFYPKGFSESGSLPGVVLANGWTGRTDTLEKYGSRFAERGLVAMVIDYRGWGKSGGFVTLAEPIDSDDRLRFTQATAKVKIKRTRLLPLKQVEDFRNAIAYLQGEPGVDRNRIGIWGTSYAGGHTMVVAATDSRVKASVCQVPAVSGKNAPKKAFELKGSQLKDAIARARTGKGGEFETGFSTSQMVDLETAQASAEYRPFHYLDQIPDNFPALFIVAENEELINNQDSAYSASKVLGEPSKVIEVEGITHFEMYAGEPFEISSKAAADWFLKYLK